MNSRWKNACKRFAQSLALRLGPSRSQADRGRAELDEEFQFHLDNAIKSHLAAGMSPAEARRQALLDFGGVEHTREETWRQRPSWLFETILQDARYAARGFLRNPTFTATVLLTLALGIGATTAVFSVVDRILFRSLPYAHDDRLVSVGLTAPIIPEEFMLGGSYFVWRDNQTPFEAFTSETGVIGCDLTEHNPARLNCATIEANFLPTLGVPLALGRNFLPEEDRPNGPKVAVLSYALWQSYYGKDPAILNRLIDVEGNPTRVIGVLPRDFQMPTLEDADILLPQALDETQQRKADPGRLMFVFARLKPGVTPDEASARLQPLFQYSLKLAPPPFRKEVHLRVRSVRDRQIQHVRLTAWVLLGAVLAVLLIACGNVASLMMARSAARERELAVRSALGASRARLVRQTLTEGLLLAFSGAVLGWGLAEALLRAFVAIAPAGIPFLDRARLDLRIAAVTFLLTLVCGALFGIPAIARPPAALALIAYTARKRAWLRPSLVVTQIAVSLVLLTGSALLVRSFWKLQQQDLGMRTRAVLTASITLGRQHYGTTAKQMQFFQQAEAALRRLPGVVAVGLSDSLPPAGRHYESILNVMTIEGRPKILDGTGGMVAWRSVTPEYFRILGLRILAGRNFTDADRTLTDRPLILSKLLADRLFPGQNPIGQRIQPVPDDPFFTVIGVAANVKNAGLAGSDEPEYYRLRRNIADDWGLSSVFVISTDSSVSATALTPWIRSQLAAIDPTVPTEIVPLQERVSKLAAMPRFQAVLVALFAATGLIMAVIGLYGLTSFLALRRTQEIGIRMALGADRASILRLIAWEGLRLTLAGGVLGMAAALAVTRLLTSMLFNIGPHDPLTFAGVAFLLMAVALIATLIPARAATRVDPVEALRRE